MPTFAKEFTYRDPMTTVTYPAGWEGRLPMERYQAARAAGSFVPQTSAEDPPLAEQADVEPEAPTDAE